MPDAAQRMQAAVLPRLTAATARRGQRAWQVGTRKARLGDWRAAQAAFVQATAACPTDALYWTNLANALRHNADFEAALAAAQQALVLAPQQATAQHLLGECLARLHRYGEAEQALAALEAAGHADPAAMLQRACMLRELQRPQDAVPVLLRALSLQPHLVRGHALLADMLRGMGLKREAVECMKTVLALEPGNLEALSHLSFEKRHLCDWADLDHDLAQMHKALQSDLDGAPPRPQAAATFGLLSLPLTPAQHLAAARREARLAQQDIEPLPALPFSAALPFTAALRLERVRLGFLSFDFREHPVSQLLVQTLETLDRSRFEVCLYSSGPDDGSPLRQRVVAAADRFVDIRGLSDQQAAQRVRADGVLLLLDLCGHTRGQRLGVLARRPAPLQVAYLGYPGSTGADFIDYVIGDARVTPLALAHHYSEKLAQMPQCLQPNGRWRPLPQPLSRAQAGLPEAGFVMCAFNHPYKILPQTFDVWCSALREVPSALLWLKQTHPALQHNLRREARLRGVDPDQLVFAGNVPYADHFSRLALADVFVDTWPYNAHTTASDALWAGLPVITVEGDSYASRVASSILHAAGLGELAFSRVADYGLALRAMAQDRLLLAPYRQHLEQQRLTLPLFDCEAHTAALQALLQRMLTRWQQGLPPQHLLAEAGPTA